MTNDRFGYSNEDAEGLKFDYSSAQKAARTVPSEPVTSDRLNRITVAIDQNLTKEEFGQQYGALTEDESKAWDDIAKEISIFAKNGIAVEIPAEFPEVFDTGLRN